MKTLVKILATSALLVLAACAPKSTTNVVGTTGTGDAYVMLFVVHTAKADVPVPYGLAVKPSVFTTLEECQKVQTELLGSFASDDAQKWFTDNQVDKKTIVCVPVSF